MATFQRKLQRLDNCNLPRRAVIVAYNDLRWIHRSKMNSIFKPIMGPKGSSLDAGSVNSSHTSPGNRRSRAVSAGSNDWISRKLTASSSSHGGEFGGRRNSGSSSSGSGRMPNPSPTFLQDMFQVGVKDFIQHYTCDGGAVVEAALNGGGGGDAVRQPFSTMLNIPGGGGAHSSPAGSLDRTGSSASSSQQGGEAGIEFDEEEILRRDYELSRV